MLVGKNVGANPEELSLNIYLYKKNISVIVF